jgi:hypothetical protein
MALGSETHFLLHLAVAPLKRTLRSYLEGATSSLITHVLMSGHTYCLGLQVALLLFRPHWPPPCNFALLNKDCDVASVPRETLIVMDRFSDFLRDGAVRGIHLLLIRGWARLLLVYLGTV